MRYRKVVSIILVILLPALLILSQLTQISSYNISNSETNIKQEEDSDIVIAHEIRDYDESIPCVDLEKDPEQTIHYSFIKPDREVIQPQIDLAEKGVETLPKEIWDKFIQAGWRLEVTTENLRYENKDVVGITFYKQRRIVVESFDPCMDETIIHEIGHFLDYKSGWMLSGNKEFSEIYEEEVEDFRTSAGSPLCADNELEFFAEGFMMYIKYPEKCTPKLYEYMRNFYQTYEKDA